MTSSVGRSAAASLLRRQRGRMLTAVPARRLVLGAILVVAAVARFVRLDVMEFKADEAEAVRLALHALGRAEPGAGTFFPTTGLTSSVGLANPPLFVYLLAPVLWLVRSPLAAAAFVAATNVVAVWLCYLAGRRYFSTFVGLAAAALFALSPWAIVYSRKIWAQDLLPITTGLFLLALHDFTVARRPRALLWLLLLVGVATQLHFSALVLAAIVVAAVALRRDAVRWPWAAAGLAGIALVYAPYVWHALAVGHLSTPGGPRFPPAALRRFTSSVRDTLAVGTGDRTYTLLGSQPALALPVSLVFGTAALGGLVHAVLRETVRHVRLARLLLPAWFVLPAAALTVVHVTPFLHYFIVLYPLPFLGAAAAVAAAARRGMIRWCAVGACLVAFAYLDVHSFRAVLADGGTASDYGVEYRYKARAVRGFVRANPGRRFELRVEPATPQARKEYALLAWLDRGAGVPALRPPVLRYVLTERFGSHGRLGPLAVRTVRLAHRR
jgi:Dolichyl-phosphate-mannose-protein mannosyltransferase